MLLKKLMFLENNFTKLDMQVTEKDVPISRDYEFFF